MSTLASAPTTTRLDHLVQLGEAITDGVELWGHLSFDLCAEVIRTKGESMRTR